MEPSISVIMPVYNVEKYLDAGIASVVNQSFPQLEIICVNDCSTDSSLEKLKNWREKDPRIRIINLEKNVGLAGARNRGIIQATGEYIGFVDPDDLIDTEFYAKLYEKARDTMADIIKGGDIHVKNISGGNEVWPQNEAIAENKLNFWVQITTAIFRKDFLRKGRILFTETLYILEDIVFAIQTAILAKSIEIVPDAHYYYIRRIDSLDSNHYDERRVRSVMDYAQIVRDLFTKSGLSKPEQLLILKRLVNHINQIRMHKVEKDTHPYTLLTSLFQNLLFEKIKLERSSKQQVE